MWNKQRYCWKSQKTCLNPEFPKEQRNDYHARKIWVSLRGPMTWKVMPRNVWNDIVSWQTRRLNDSTKYQHHVLTTITSKKKNWIPWEIVQKCVLKLFWNACTSHVLEDLIFYGQRTNLHDQSLNWLKHVTNDYLVWSPTTIPQVNTNSIATWETLQNNADWLNFESPILQEILRIQNLHQVEHCAWLEVIRLFQSAGCVRNKLQCRTVQQNRKSFPWTQDWGWTVYPHLLYGICSSQFFTGNTYQSDQKLWDPYTNLVRAAPHKLQMRKKSHGMIDDLDNVDFILSNVHSSRQEALLYIFEDSEAVIKMITKGRSPTMIHVSRIHRSCSWWVVW